MLLAVPLHQLEHDSMLLPFCYILRQTCSSFFSVGELKLMTKANAFVNPLKLLHLFALDMIAPVRDADNRAERGW